MFLFNILYQRLQKKITRGDPSQEIKSTKLYLDCRLNLVEGVVHMEEGVGTEAARDIVY